MPSPNPDPDPHQPDPHRSPSPSTSTSTSTSPRPVDSQPPVDVDHEPVPDATMSDDEPQPPSAEPLPAQAPMPSSLPQELAHAPLSTADSPPATDLVEANATIARLRAELASLPAYYTSRNQLDHDRLASDNLQLRTQATVLARKVATLEADKLALVAVKKGKGKARADDDDDERDDDQDETASQATEVDEYERDATIAQLESDKRALTVDVHRLQDRLDIAEQQTKRLSHELRSLRAYFLHGSPLVTLEADIALPSPPASQTSPASPPDPLLPPSLDAPAPTTSSSSSSRASRPTPRSVALADAEAELLLHAGKTLSHVHRVTRVPLSRAIAERADDIVRASARDGNGRAHAAAAGLGERQGQGQGQGQGQDGLDGLMQLANASSQEDLAPGALPGSSMSLRALRTSSRRGRASRSGASGAGQDGEADEGEGEDAAMGGLELPVPPAHYNPYSLDPPPPHLAMRAGVAPGGGGGGFGAGGGGAGRAAPDDDPDYLPSPPPAAAAAAAAAAGPSAWPYAYELPYPGGAPHAGPSGASSSSAAPHPHPNPRQALGQRLSALDVLAQATAEMDHEGMGMSDHGRGLYEGGSGWHAEGSAAQQGGKKAGVPSSRSRVPAVGPDGQKKPRSPYIKWNLQEDEQLLRAVIQVGCSWDNVAKLCPTRAYHQVRQRFLRGLRSGEQLPKQLMHLQEAVRKSVRDHEAKKKRKRAAKQHVAVDDADAV
ncbi:uncharacterized protein RHOBADRAFT_52092 [Rhodotorula graminis WP1]|uniref:Uncharacterized protein n=1 Tax=Rhodotorula graminis (strain WP1) TaxID=578459 RepID=A0A194S983_RHOGW|nr:uncharacterized protein RHOBADRAFT_52092 [Rhodotorula graminis WP1]KPV77144.1 hypothetical protein RHOBADRAFT_52092 [Rhodotorula graminis WP1]